MFTFTSHFSGIYTQDFTQVFVGANIMKASIVEPCKPMEHPLETGALITDHIIFLQNEIELYLLLNASSYVEIYKQIKQFKNNATLLNVQTKTDVYPNMFIYILPHEEDPEFFDTVTIRLRLRQAQFSTAQSTVSPSNPTNSTTIDRGTQQTSATTLSPSQNVQAVNAIENTKGP